MSDLQSIGYVEDDPSLGMLLADQLEQEGWKVHWFQNGKEALEAFASNCPDFFVLDVMLPGLDGFSLAEKLRETAPEVPILFLTAKGETPDRLKSLTLGDDYLAKPFSIEELILRIKNLWNRATPNADPSPSVFALGTFTFDSTNFLLSHPEVGDRRLTEREGKLLHALCKLGHRVVKREELMREVWGKDDYFTGRSMDVFISKLRKYLSADARIKIQVVHGIGFEFIVPTKSPD